MSKGKSTRLIHARTGGRLYPTVNPPIERASTLLLPSEKDLYAAAKTYGRMGLAVHRELEAALCELEGAASAQLAPSGLTACALAVSAITKAGDHVIAQDSLYGPTRRFCSRRLKAMGVETSFAPARIGSGVAELIRPNTKAIFLEAPGSLTFETPDTPAIVDVAKRHGVRVIVDNTWSAGVFHRPLELGADMSVQALTKYVVGHADAFAGAVMSADDQTSALVAATREDWGLSPGPDDAYAALRGLRTLPVRLKAHEAAGLAVAEWLSEQPEVAQVLHPALPDHPDHAIWARDFSGASGLFGVMLHPQSDAAMDAFYQAFEVFGFGFSWGGYESLIISSDSQLRRLSDDWTRTKSGPLMRLHIGLEDVDDLIDDLSSAFNRLRSIS